MPSKSGFNENGNLCCIENVHIYYVSSTVHTHTTRHTFRHTVSISIRIVYTYLYDRFIYSIFSPSKEHVA